MGKSRYTLRVDEEDLDRWNDAVEDSETEYASLRHLIELSVTRELSDNFVLRDDIEGLNVGIDSSIETGIDELRNEMSELRKEVESLELASSDSELVDLATALHSWVPIVERDELNGWLEMSVRNTPQISLEDAVEGYGRVQDFVRFMDEEEWQIRKAIAKLEHDMDDVHTGMDAEGSKRVFELVDERPDDGTSEDND